MIGRALLIWLLIAVLANLNGALRQFVINPLSNEGAGHVISTLMLAGIVLLTTWLTIGWMRPSTAGEAWTIGAVWLLLTLAFEFGFGHFVFGKPWSVLLADHRLDQGRIWTLVPVVTTLAPWLAGRWKGLW